MTRSGVRMDKAAREKLAIALLVVFLGGWIATSIVIQIVQVHDYGYGRGIGDGGHVPPSVRDKIGADGNIEQLMKATNR